MHLYLLLEYGSCKILTSLHELGKAALSATLHRRGRSFEVHLCRKLVFNPAHTLRETENDLRNGLTERARTEFVAEFSFDFSSHTGMISGRQYRRVVS